MSCNYEDYPYYIKDKTGRGEERTITAKIAVDNFYAIYHGEEGSIQYVGSGENWDLHEYTFTSYSSDYIYIAAWSDDAVAQGLLVELKGEGTILSGDENFSVFATGNNLDAAGESPTVSDIESEIDRANAGDLWVKPVKGHANSVSAAYYPWGVTGFESDPAWIWYDSGSCPGSDTPFLPACNHDEYIIFRIQTGSI